MFGQRLVEMFDAGFIAAARELALSLGYPHDEQFSEMERYRAVSRVPDLMGADTDAHRRYMALRRDLTDPVGVRSPLERWGCDDVPLIL